MSLKDFASQENELPQQWVRDLIDQAAYLRGRYLTSYAQCEFLLADLSVRVDGRFRYALDKRINAAKVMAESGGLLDSYASDFLPLIEHLHDWTERRHWLAHGFLIFTQDQQKRHLFEYRRYEQREDKLQLLQWQVTIDDLQDAVDAIGRYTQAFVALCRRIYLDLKIEEL
ncbi:hypothetical protein WN73_12440 [Bradyrhizobium sp. CCBAU 45394]|uniref:hypothetical protein n=1 Tax=Bradyrhizobium sp. CCBAU 45394 TaxID=1325087 RepID=UPI0023044801|nr:hypothetical protein [Bradyrhizobium sp. CCBAU 45394]MDA9391449.1 hypothetical protein [Bradyrhizobium sp. CCBAU 45394]